jgi:hypothetical protein
MTQMTCEKQMSDWLPLPWSRDRLTRAQAGALAALLTSSRNAVAWLTDPRNGRFPPGDTAYAALDLELAGLLADIPGSAP